MSRKSLAVSILLVALAGARAPSALAESPLTAEVMIVVLRPDTPADRSYLVYVATLLDHGQLPRHLVESTFLWAREKPRHKFQYFKRALIVRADADGIDLPNNDAPVSGDIEGRAMYAIDLALVTIHLPLGHASVEIVGTDRKTTTNGRGEFSFSDVPFGSYRVYARGKGLLSTKSGSVRVSLPTPPPSDTPAHAFIVAR